MPSQLLPLKCDLEAAARGEGVEGEVLPRLVVISRNPRDVAVSGYKFFGALPIIDYDGDWRQGSSSSSVEAGSDGSSLETPREDAPAGSWPAPRAHPQPKPDHEP
jgi:hypothetical protein